MKNVIVINSITVLLLMVSAVINLQKTNIAVKKGIKTFFKMAPSVLTVFIFSSIVLSLTSDELIVKYLGEESGIGGFFIAACIGSISLLPGYIAYPLGSIMLQNGVSYQILSVFITTLLMVGIVTLPLEMKYFGIKISMLRNFLFFLGALVAGIIMGFFQ